VLWSLNISKSVVTLCSRLLAFFMVCRLSWTGTCLWASVFLKTVIIAPWVYKVKVKCTLVQALRLCAGCMAHRGSRGIALPFQDLALEGGEGSALCPGRSLPPGKTRYPLYKRLGGLQGRSWQVRKILPPPAFDSWTVQPLASRYTDYITQPTLECIKCWYMV
jgi:hypothetical protein